MHHLASYYIVIMSLYDYILICYVNQWNLRVESRIWFVRQFFLCYWQSFIPLLRYILVSEKTGTPGSTPKEVSLAESLKKRAAAMVRDSENMTCHKKLKESEFFNLSQRKESTFVCFCIKYCLKVERTKSFCIPVIDKMRSHRIKLQQGSFRLDTSKCNLI